MNQENIKIGTHGENYGSWMSMPVFYMMGGIAALVLILAILSFARQLHTFGWEKMKQESLGGLI